MPASINDHWLQPSEAVQNRFAKRLDYKTVITYAGEVVESRRTWLGWALTIIHEDPGDGAFAFIVSLRHPWSGEVLRQVALFRERG